MPNSQLVKRIRVHDQFARYKSPRDEGVLEAMAKVDRKLFLPEDSFPIFAYDPEIFKEVYLASKNIRHGIYDQNALNFLLMAHEAIGSPRVYYAEIQGLAYNDLALPIGHEQTCSQPSLIAFMADILELGQGMRVFELGTGCGYHAAITSYLLEDGFLVSSESRESLAAMGKKNLKRHFGDDLERRVKLVSENGFKVLKEEALFDRIYFTAAVDSGLFYTRQLAQHLRDGTGIVLVPDQRDILIWEKYRDGKRIDQRIIPDIYFVKIQPKSS